MIITWVYEHNFRWHVMPAKNQIDLELALVRQSVVYLQYGRTLFKYDLARMTQQNLQTGTVRRIMRLVTEHPVRLP